MSAGRLTDPLLRLLGADPATFRPLYRTQKLLLQRGVRLIRVRRGLLASLTPLRLLWFFAGVYGLIAALTIAGARSPLLGAVLSLVLGCGFLLLVVVTGNNFDMLVNSREMLVLGAYPQDGRSLLLAKLVAFGRHLSIVAVLLFGFPGIAAGFALRSPMAAPAFWAGAAAAGVSTVTFGLLSAAALLRTGGKGALDRLLPWIQGAFQFGYFLVIGGQRLMSLTTAPGPGALGLLPWVLPPFWFIAPVELAAAGFSAPALGRLALAMVTPALLLGGATRWLGAGLRERLLEPQQRMAPWRPATRRRPARALRRGGERARLYALLRVQLRADWHVRSEFLLVPLMGIFLMVFYVRDFGIVRSIPLPAVYVYCWLVMVGTEVLTRSSRPESLWWLLVSPVDRVRFSLGTISLVRLFQLGPLFAAMALAQIRAGGTWPLRLALLAELLVMGDLLIVVGKGIFPDFPFSQSRTDGGAAGARTLLVTLLSGLCGGVATAAVLVSGLSGMPGALAGAACFALLHLPAGFWARRRAAVAAEGLEITA